MIPEEGMKFNTENGVVELWAQFPNNNVAWERDNPNNTPLHFFHPTERVGYYLGPKPFVGETVWYTNAPNTNNWGGRERQVFHESEYRKWGNSKRKGFKKGKIVFMGKLELPFFSGDLVVIKEVSK